MRDPNGSELMASMLDFDSMKNVKHQVLAYPTWSPGDLDASFWEFSTSTSKRLFFGGNLKGSKTVQRTVSFSQISFGVKRWYL